MSCEFKPSSTNCRPDAIICQSGQALNQISQELEGIYTLAQLREELCNNPVPEAREQCSAYLDLCSKGKQSPWAR